MNEINNTIKVNETEYPLRFDINLLVWAQQKYGSYSRWLNMLSPTSPYDGFDIGDFRNLEKFNLGYKPNKVGVLKMLEDAEKLTGKKYNWQNPEDIRDAIKAILEDECLPEPEDDEINMSVFREAFTEMINEGIEYENFVKNTTRAPITEKQCGFIISELGMGEAMSAITTTLNASGAEDSDTKNVQ